MSLATQSLMVQDDGLLRRIAAAASHHGIRDALPWAVDHAWLVTATEGWAARYYEASKNDPPVEPAAWYGIHGSKPDVITDDMILVSVSEVLARAAQAEAALSVQPSEEVPDGVSNSD